MAGSDVLEHGVPLQIICIVNKEEDGKSIHELKLIRENLEKIVLHPDVKDRFVVIVSIAGAFRKGKSFLLGFLLKYLETQPHDWNWLGKDDKIEGFEWRSGTEGVTTGIQIWSKPFILEDKSGKEVAILLMDTQGVFDNDSTLADCAGIFALSNLISSVQMYNLMHQLQEDDLQYLEFFTEFGKLVNDQSKEKGVNNSRLVFLIRDWGIPGQHPYGKDGGEAYIRKKLQIKPNHHEELKKIRRNLKECFPNTGGFLLPYPGKTVVTKETYDGTVKDMDDEFIESVKLLVPYILSKDNLVIKQIDGVDVTGQTMLDYIEVLVNALKNGELPTPQTLIEATAEIGCQLAIDAEFEIYIEEMTEFCKSANGEYISEDGLRKVDKEIKYEAIKRLESYPRMLRMKNQSQCVKKLSDLMDMKYNDFKKIIEKQNRAFLLKKVVPAVGIGIGGVALCALGVKKTL